MSAYTGPDDQDLDHLGLCMLTLTLQSGYVPASLWWLLLQSDCVSGFVVVAATSVWLCVWLHCGGCYFTLAVCLALLWWLLLQSCCVIGFIVVAASSVCSCVMFEIDLYTGMCVAVLAIFTQCRAQNNILISIKL